MPGAGCWPIPTLADRLRTALRAAPDMARALARLSLGRGGPRDLAVLRDGMQAARAAATLFDGPLPALLAGALAGLLVDLELEQMLAAALADPAPLRLDDGGVIRPGFDPALDAERALRDDSRRVLTTMQLDLAQRYGVASLKIRHHAQLGYVIEAPAPAVEKLRAEPDLTLRQGMASGARFTSPELSDLDRRITEAAERAGARERVVFAHLVEAALTTPNRSAAVPRRWRCWTCSSPPPAWLSPAHGAGPLSPTTTRSDRRRASSGGGSGVGGPGGFRPQRLRFVTRQARCCC